jgi:cytochrome c oxidase subunit 3
MNNIRHPYHLVEPSPWPILASTAGLCLTMSGVMYFHDMVGVSRYLLGASFLFLLFVVYSWFLDIVKEGSIQGYHTHTVQKGLRYGMILFIVSEVMFFFAFFWAFFHSSLAPTIEIGSVWPPLGIEVLNPWDIPLLNTLILLLSGVTVTWAHHSIVAGERKQAIISLTLTVSLGIIFTIFQALEYIEANFTISDSVYGSTFYMATGFHGFHVLIGTIFLSVCLLRLFYKHFTRQHHFGFEAAAWYWHFVDVVWLFLFITIYWWGGS